MNLLFRCTFIFILVLFFQPSVRAAEPIIGERIYFDDQAFEIEKFIESGGFGSVYKIRSVKDSNIVYALKVFSNEKERLGMTSAQTRAASNKAYQRVIRIASGKPDLKFAPRFIKVELNPLAPMSPLEAIALAGHPSIDLVVVMPLASSDLQQLFLTEGKTLAGRMGLAVKVINEILPELAFLSNHQLVHNDIKLENILVSKDTGQFGITDFDSLVKAGEVTSLGTPFFNAPERGGLGKTMPVYPVSDIYNLGMVVATILATDPENPYREIDLRDSDVLQAFLEKLGSDVKETHPELNEAFQRVKDFLGVSLDPIPSQRLEKLKKFTTLFDTEHMIWRKPEDKFAQELELFRRDLKKNTSLFMYDELAQRIKRLNPRITEMLEILAKENSFYIDALFFAAKLGIELPNEKALLTSKLSSVPFRDLQQIENLKAYLKIKAGLSATFMDAGLQNKLDQKLALLSRPGRKGSSGLVPKFKQHPSEASCLSVYQ